MRLLIFIYFMKVPSIINIWRFLNSFFLFLFPKGVLSTLRPWHVDGWRDYYATVAQHSES